MKTHSLLLVVGFFAVGITHALDPIPPIARVLPPLDGVTLPDDLRTSLTDRIRALDEQIAKLSDRDHIADAGALVKAVRYAVELGEFYSDKEFPRASSLLDLAEERMRTLQKPGKNTKLSWLTDRGLIVRGYRSRIDDSFQPFGLEIPENLDLSKPVPVLVWLHGRGDKSTDIHFLDRCRVKSQALGGFFADQQQAIVLHPFGRQCVGWKHAGEIDVFEAIDALAADYPIDRDRIVLAGFSMGGAGAWHIGAHYRDQFCGVHTGAGFIDTKVYNNLTPDRYPPEYEQTLWQLYDVPPYAPNFLNGPLLAYSGEKDRQKLAADSMAQALADIGYTMQHVIAPDTEHRYTKEGVEEIRKWLDEVWQRGRQRPASTIHWSTPTLRYGKYDWLQLTRLEKHWVNTSSEITWDPQARKIQARLKGITAFEIHPDSGQSLAGTTLEIDGRTLPLNPSAGVKTSFILRDGTWASGEPTPGGKRPGLQGPIDDAFMGRFIVVPPDQAPADPLAARWTEFELEHFRSRWQALMRGDLPEKAAKDITIGDLRDANLILWGDPESNRVLARIADKLPVSWAKDTFTMNGKTYDRHAHVPVLIFPNPLAPDRYIVINSGLTFREGHDRTNSLQNPKLPDWAVIGLDVLPDALSPGRIVEAGFFDEDWK